MTEAAIVSTEALDSAAAARELATQISQSLAGHVPDAVMLFASPRYDHEELLYAFNDACRPRALVGASSAGEFTLDVRGQGRACALALRSTEMTFSAAIGHGLGKDRRACARELTSHFRGIEKGPELHRGALVMTDALAGHADDLIDRLTLATLGKYKFFGGGAGDNAQFVRTRVFCGEEVASDAAVGLEILSRKPLGVGVGHGFEPTSPRMRVTASDGMRVLTLNGYPAARAFELHADETKQAIDRTVPSYFLLNNVLGIETPAGFRLRVPLALLPDGSVQCCAEVPEGAIVRIMSTTERSAIAAAERAAEAALDGIEGHRPLVALFFDCVASRLRMRELFDYEIDSVEKKLSPAPLVGCNTHGQIARADGQFGGFHNCTAVVCVLPN